ncbi:chemotaxis protein CheA, partial [Pseudophaeobacter sp.]
VSDSPASEDPTEAATMDDNTAEEVAEKVDFFDEDLPAEPVTSAPRSDTVPAADSIAAKLLRIRSVVAKAPEEEFSEDEHAETFIETARAEMAQVEDEDLEDIDAESDEISRVLDRIDLTGKRADAASAAQEAEAPSEPQTPAPSSEALINSVLQETAPDPVAEPTAAAQPDAQPVTQADSRAAQEPPARPKRGMRLGRPKASEDVALNTASDTSALDTTAAPSPAEDAAAEPAPTAPETAPQTAKPLRARIVKVKRADLEQAMSSGNLEEVVETPTDETPDNTPSAESSLDADEEADLMRELAEVEAELLASNQDSAQISEVQAETDAPSPKSAPEQAADSASAREVTSRANPQTTQPADSDVTRLMEAAESKLGDPDNATSRETYSHLRAAVAAAEADRSASPTGAKTDEAEPYREDLASVVRPRRPEAGEATRSRSTGSRTGSRPAPLKLVAEQRIEPEVKTSAKPVRPRRISMAADDTPSAQAEAFGSFTDYVQDLGATELHEMLEAAASYLSFVEGRDKFSRPQLMNKVRSVGHGDFNRENGLRSIGQLLREGKIERSDNGQFTATDDIGFRPRKRAAG